MKDGGNLWVILSFRIEKIGCHRESRPAQVRCFKYMFSHHVGQVFEESCHYHAYNDIEIKILLQNFQNDIQNALDGTVEFYHGPLPEITGVETIRIYREITLRRMKIIEEKFINNLDNI